MEEDLELDQKKLKAALEKVSKHNQAAAPDERKRVYNSFAVRALPCCPDPTFRSLTVGCGKHMHVCQS